MGTIANGPISDWQTDQISMVSKSGAYIAEPSLLSTDGHSFSISYVTNSNNTSKTLTVSDSAHAANMALLGDAGQHFSPLKMVETVGVADVHHDGHLV
jgi:hypothetical protein